MQTPSKQAQGRRKHWLRQNSNATGSEIARPLTSSEFLLEGRPLAYSEFPLKGNSPAHRHRMHQPNSTTDSRWQLFYKLQARTDPGGGRGCYICAIQRTPRCQPARNSPNRTNLHPQSGFEGPCNNTQRPVCRKPRHALSTSANSSRLVQTNKIKAKWHHPATPRLVGTPDRKSG